MRITKSAFQTAAAVAALLAISACAENPAPAPVAAAPAPAPAGPTDVEVLFPEGAARLTTDANAKLDQAARLFREGNPAVMFVSGHSDSKGKEFGNLVLSARRARAVKDALVARGIPGERLQLVAFGEAPPLDAKTPAPTDNRRVVITWR